MKGLPMISKHDCWGFEEEVVSIVCRAASNLSVLTSVDETSLCMEEALGH